jgi:hypothetical protein
MGLLPEGTTMWRRNHMVARGLGDRGPQMLNYKLFQYVTKNSSATALCALALRSATGPSLQAASLECLPAFLAQ